MAKLTSVDLLKAIEEMSVLELKEFLDAFEEKFDLEIPDEDAEKITTVQSAIDYIVSKQ